MSEQNQMVKVPVPGELVATEFGKTSAMISAETSAAALAKHAEASVNARYIMAMQRPRDLMAARARLLKDCERPLFAEKAIYRKPIGQGIEGPSIRLAEAAARALTNILTEVSAVYDDDKKRIVVVMASDLETNVTYTKPVTIPKAVERSSANGKKVISQRLNSNGKTTYLVEATDDEIADRENALVSKAMRGCLLRLVPGDILEEAIQECYATMDKKDAQDPDAALKKLADAFAAIGVTPDNLAQYLGHPLAQTQAKELQTLRGIYSAIKDGESSWAEVLAAKDADKKPEAKPEVKAGEKPQTLADVAKAATKTTTTEGSK
jgi:hypothetical protein